MLVGRQEDYLSLDGTLVTEKNATYIFYIMLLCGCQSSTI